MNNRYSHLFRSSLIAVCVLLAVGIFTSASCGQGIPAVSSQEFRNLITEISEPAGRFHSDNWVSNELTYAEAFPVIKKHKIHGGVYIGVGPSQNFNYIKEVKPDIAFIVDIRGLNVIQHLFFKTAFELSENRAEFISFLFSLPLRRNSGLNADSNIEELVRYFSSADKSADLAEKNTVTVADYLAENYGFSLDTKMRKDIQYVVQGYYKYGLNATYWGPGRRGYPGYTQLLLRKTDGSSPHFLNSRQDFLYIKKMQHDNRIIPIVGDFAGREALRNLANYLRRNNRTVSAFYTSNVEQFLIGKGPRVWKSWESNVRNLPITEKSVLIKWLPGNTNHTYLQWITTFNRNARAGKYRRGRDILYDDFIKN